MKNLIRPLLALVLIGYIAFNRVSSRGSSELDQIAERYLSGTSVHDVVDDLKEFVETYPKNEKGWIIYGNVLNDLDADSLAGEAYKSALSLNSKSFQAINGLGILYRRQGMRDSARVYYQRAIEIEPHYAQAYSSLAVIELQEGNDAEALRLGELAYKYDPEDDKVVANLAVTYHYNNLYEKRDTFTKLAESMGYTKAGKLKLIYSGEMTIRAEGNSF